MLSFLESTARRGNERTPTLTLVQLNAVGPGNVTTPQTLVDT